MMELYQQVFRNTYQFTGILDPEGVLLDANDTALNFIMKKKEDVVGRFFWDTEWWSHDSELQETLKNAIIQLRADKISHRFEVTHPRHDHQIAAFDFSVTPLLDDEGVLQYIIAEGRDVSQIKEAERNREISEIRYRDLFKYSRDACLIIEEDRFIEFNPATVQMLGFENDSELFGLHPSSISPEYQPDGRLSYEKANEMIQIAYEKGTNRFEWLHVKKDGTVFPAEVLLTRIRQAERHLLFTVWRDITEVKANEAKIIQMNQELENKIEERTKALKESLSELEKAQSTLVESRKLAALGQLIIGISHEMNTPIGTAITGISYLSTLMSQMREAAKSRTESECEKALEAIDDAVELIARIHKSLNHAADLVNNFKELSREPLEDRIGEVNLRELIETAIIPFKDELKLYHHRLDIHVPDDYTLSTDALTLGNIFSQLISNALSHGFEERLDGVILIGLHDDENEIKITFEDDGKGFTQEELERVFDPFYTTHRGSGKIGLGMNILYNQVTQILHGNVIVRNSANTSGCEVVITIPKIRI